MTLYKTSLIAFELKWIQLVLAEPSNFIILRLNASLFSMQIRNKELINKLRIWLYQQFTEKTWLDLNSDTLLMDSQNQQTQEFAATTKESKKERNRQRDVVQPPPLAHWRWMKCKLIQWRFIWKRPANTTNTVTATALVFHFNPVSKSFEQIPKEK